MTSSIHSMTLFLALGVMMGTACFDAGAEAAGLAIAESETGKAYLTYRGAPLFAFGPGDEMRTLSGAADVERWAAWQREHGMNLIRAYPTSVPVELYGAPGRHPFQRCGDRWDVDAFDEAYFERLGEVAALLERHDIILHLQLWQIVFFKGGDKRWPANYLNPENNCNDWTKGFARGRDYIDAPEGSAAREHQRKWVGRILDALKGRGNVIIDVINELGNEMGSIEWAVEVTRWIRAWEREQGQTFIVGVDSEHVYRPDRFGPFQQHFDIIIFNELVNRDFAMNAIAAFNMPAITVRSSDGRNQWSDYMFALPEQTGPEHQTRYRTLCYRSLFAGVQSIGAYWKPEIESADYRDMKFWPRYARGLRTFWEHIAPYWPTLAPMVESERISAAVTPHAWALESPELLLVYLECGSHTWNNEYPPSRLKLRSPFESGEAQLYDPWEGVFLAIESVFEDGEIRINLPAFTDDMVVIVKWADATR